MIKIYRFLNAPHVNLSSATAPELADVEHKRKSFIAGYEEGGEVRAKRLLETCSIAEKAVIHRAIIEKVNELISEELERPSLPPELVPEDRFVVCSSLPDKGKDSELFRAFLDVSVERIFVGVSAAEHLHVLLHEAIHYFSARVYSFDLSVRDDSADRHRIGYCYPRKDRSLFRGLNEAVTEKLTEEILLRNAKQLSSMTGYDTSSLREASGYKYFVDTLERVIEGIAKCQRTTKEEAWRIIKRGMFTGEMMHLRAVDRAFGAGSLAVLAALWSNPDTTSIKEEYYQAGMIHSYFDGLPASSERARNRLKDEILAFKPRE